MVKIRYSELPAGLHVEAAADRDGTVVYLQPGLTPAQRRAALVRVRSSARIGQGPTLPGPAMARAIAADRVRTTAHIGAAATRRHPMLFLPPVIILVVSALAFVFMTVQPLTAANQGSVGAALPTLGVGAGQLPTTPNLVPLPRHHHHHSAHHSAATPSTQHPQVQSGLPTACLLLQSPLRRLLPQLPVPRPSAALVSRCDRRFQHWLRTRG